jgi:iron complex outermembrane receptor protein
MGTSVAQDSASVAGLEEIIVTARKKAETLIETPVAVSVLTSEDIEAKGVRDLYDVALFTPGLTYFDAIQNQLGTPVIRGISQTNLNSPDRNVAIFYGGVYLSNTSASKSSKVRSRPFTAAMPSTARSTSFLPHRPASSRARSAEH